LVRYEGAQGLLPKKLICKQYYIKSL